jgi:hypothetical protein
MHGDYAHRNRFSNDNPKDAVGKFGHLTQAVLQLRVKLIIFNKIWLRHDPFDPGSLNLSLCHATDSVLRILKIAHPGTSGHGSFAFCILRSSLSITRTGNSASTELTN